MASTAKMDEKDLDQANLKIRIDNSSNINEMEEGEVEDSSDDEVRTKSRRLVPQKKVRKRVPVEDPIIKYDRPLPSPVESEEDNTLTVDMGDLETFGVAKQPKPKVYENPSQDSFVLGFDPDSEEAQKRKVDRAKRFGIEEATASIPIDPEELKTLYESLGLSELETSAGFGERGIRLEAVHLRGTDNMSTEDIFSYFKDVKPKSIEWIDDSSCNVIWHDKISAAKAIIKKSTNPANESEKPKEKVKESMKIDDKEETKVSKEEAEAKNNKKEETAEVAMEDDDDLNLLSSDEEEETATTGGSGAAGVKARQTGQESGGEKKQEETMETEQPKDDKHTDKSEEAKDKEASSNNQFSSSNLIRRILPPGNWRLGLPCNKAKFLFMRFANKVDRKKFGAEKRSQYYREYGNPNFGGMTGLISSSRKRKIMNSKYHNEVQEARRAVKKTEKYYHGIPAESDFDRHLREAKRAKNMYTVASKNSDDDQEGAYSDEDQSYTLNQYYDNAEENTTWGRAESDEDKGEGKEEGQEEEFDFELELGELMKKAPTYRVGRMYADDLEEEIKSKREAAAEITQQMLAQRDARSQIEQKRQQKSHHHHHKSHKHRRRMQADSDEEVLNLNLQNSDNENNEVEVVVAVDDLRDKVPHRHREGHRSHHRRRKDRHHHSRGGEGGRRRSRAAEEEKAEVDVSEGDNESATEDLMLESNPSESNFRYEKLRIQVDPDDV